ncbi:DUF6069 family protein [Umezawaea beigongshangensis]|uniref:DUF6069 family protein n=1 Tax=Umezawaea beigongshangensis TaxID=2780383 RepID=UPI0018F1EF6D|nr:DUF6069 family protein [Umezawaea beigongshangensis]
MTTTQARSTRQRDRAVVAAAAIATPVLLWALITYVFGFDITVPESFGSDARTALEPVPVLGTAVAAVLAGWASLALLERFAGARALTIWTAVAVIVFLGTLPYMPGFTTTERLLLGLVHLSLALVLVVGMRRTARAGV